jgi:hypothetical protein
LKSKCQFSWWKSFNIFIIYDLNPSLEIFRRNFLYRVDSCVLHVIKLIGKWFATFFNKALVRKWQFRGIPVLLICCTFILLKYNFKEKFDYFCGTQVEKPCFKIEDGVKIAKSLNLSGIDSQKTSFKENFFRFLFLHDIQKFSCLSDIKNLFFWF